MTGNTTKAVLLTIHELLLLLYKKEISGIVFPESISEAGADELQLKTAMAELISDKYLTPGDDNSYHISPEMVQILSVMENASCTYVVMGDHLKMNTVYLYRHNNDAVKLTMDQRRKGWVRLELSGIDDHIKEITDLEFMPQEGLTPETTQEVDDAVYDSEDTSELIRSQEVCLLAERYPKGAREYDRRVCVTTASSQDRIIVIENGTKEMTPYTADSLADKILEG